MDRNESKGTILIVDDQENWYEALAQLFADYHVDMANNFDDASQLIDKLEFDVVILDIRLVDRDEFNVEGLQLLKALRSKGAETGIVVLTGYPEVIQEKFLQKYKPDMLMRKSTTAQFNADDFRESVEELIKRYRSMR